MYSLVDLRYQSKRRTPEELLTQLKSFSLDLKLTVGIWFFAPSGGRFHERYVPEMSVADRIGLAAEMARYGVKGIEAHYPSEVNPENLHLYKKLEKESGIRLVQIGPDGFSRKAFEFGTLANPDKKKREEAQKSVIEALKLVKEAGAQHMGVWPGQ